MFSLVENGYNQQQAFLEKFAVYQNPPEGGKLMKMYKH
jgi:hypothetical protein